VDYRNRVAEGSGNVDPSGNFSIEVLRAALRSQYSLDLPSIGQDGVLESVGDVTHINGFICNKEAHWFAIRMINGRFWNLNSMKDQPQIIGHFKLAAEIQELKNSGYSVFCVPFGLPEPCTSKAQRSRGKPQFWWKEEDLVQGKGSRAINGANDPWKDVGSGMRLDGGRATSSNSSNDYAGLTEEEQMQMAIAASMEPVAAAPANDIMPPLTEEPAGGTEGAVRIQFRLPGGGRAVRRFLKSDPVKLLYSYVNHEATDGQGRKLELKSGFPPKDVQAVADKTIGEASLAGESIQCRWL
jgi:ataxin-3